MYNDDAFTLALSTATDDKCQHYLQDWASKYRLIINQVSRELVENKTYVAKAEQLMIEPQTWKIFINKLRRSLTLDPMELVNDKEEFLNIASVFDKELELRRNQAIAINTDSDYTFDVRKESVDRVYDFASKRAQLDLQDSIYTQRVLQNTTDLRVPHEWYPFTRITKRKIIFHGGPTNSGA